MITDYEWECIRDEIARQVGEIIDHLTDILDTLSRGQLEPLEEEEQR